MEAVMGLFGKGNDDDGDHVRFQMKEKLFSLGDDYWIEDHDGHRAYKVDGTAFRVRDTWHLRDEEGREVASIHEKLLTVRDTMVIEFGGKTATLKKALIGIRERYVVEVEGGDEFKVHGNVVDHEYEIEHDDHTIAHVSKKWFKFRDTYGVEVRAPQYTALILAITVAVDAISHDLPG
jgi:uncharacterized protein YxjI